MSETYQADGLDALRARCFHLEALTVAQAETISDLLATLAAERATARGEFRRGWDAAESDRGSTQP